MSATVKSPPEPLHQGSRLMVLIPVAQQEENGRIAEGRGQPGQQIDFRLGGELDVFEDQQQRLPPGQRAESVGSLGCHLVVGALPGVYLCRSPGRGLFSHIDRKPSSEPRAVVRVPVSKQDSAQASATIAFLPEGGLQGVCFEVKFSQGLQAARVKQPGFSAAALADKPQRLKGSVFADLLQLLKDQPAFTFPPDEDRAHEAR